MQARYVAVSTGVPLNVQCVPSRQGRDEWWLICHLAGASCAQLLHLAGVLPCRLPTPYFNLRIVDPVGCVMGFALSVLRTS